MENRFSKKDIEDLRNEFCSILRKVNRQNADIEGLITKLTYSQFFTSPASTKYHNAFEGGLVDHSLNVYYNLKSLVNAKHLTEEIPEESIIICGLLHDISKMGYYEKSIRNKKVYSESGSKFDTLGNFDWVSEEVYSKIPDKERFVYGNHEETSEFMVRQYIPLKLSESIAILNHHGGKGYDSTGIDISPMYCRYPLANLLHVADMIATYTDERY